VWDELSVERAASDDELATAVAGALGVVWALVRIAWPLRRLVASDAVARIGVAALIAYAIQTRGVTPVLWTFVATELIGSAAQAWVLPRLRDPRESVRLL